MENICAGIVKHIKYVVTHKICCNMFFHLKNWQLKTFSFKSMMLFLLNKISIYQHQKKNNVDAVG